MVILMFKKNKSSKLLIAPLVLATTVAFANWGNDDEEINANNVTTHDEDRSAFIDLTTMVAAGDLEGAQSQVMKPQRIKALGLRKAF